MNKYSPTIRSRAVARLVGPHAISARRLAVELGISEATLSRWRQAAANIPNMPPRTPPQPAHAPLASPFTIPNARPRTAREELVLAARV